MDLQNFRLRLRKQLQTQKLTLNALSLQADLSEDTLRSIIYGKSQDIKLSTIIKIADVLNCSIDDMIGRTFYSPEINNIANRLNHLSARSINTIMFLLDLEETSSVLPSNAGNDIIRVLLPNGNMKDGMYYDSCSVDELDISAYPTSLKKVTDFAIKITTHNYEPIYCMNDLLLISHQSLPESNDIVLCMDAAGKLFIRRYSEDGLDPINGFGKVIPFNELKNYKLIGVILKVVKEYNIEQYR